MQNIEYLKYTYMHRKAFLFVVNEIVKDEEEKEELLERAKWHDLDKSLLYTLIEKESASKIHIAHSSHHMENGLPKIKYDKMEAIFDYESAGYTKPDKPRNAFDTVTELRPHHMEILLPYMEHFGIAKSYKNTPNDKKWKEFCKGIEEPTEEMILDEIYQYILHNPKEAKNVYEYASAYRKLTC